MLHSLSYRQHQLHALVGSFHWPITVAARSKAWTVFYRTNTGIVCSNPIRGMDVCERLFCVQVEALRQADPPYKESYRLCKRSRNWKSSQGPIKGCRATDSFQWSGNWLGPRVGWIEARYLFVQHTAQWVRSAETHLNPLTANDVIQQVEFNTQYVEPDESIILQQMSESLLNNS
jgi:hypothetical protein